MDRTMTDAQATDLRMNELATEIADSLEESGALLRVRSQTLRWRRRA